MRPFQAERVPRPELTEEFSSWLGSEPIDLEIGAGQGLHAIRYCQQNPARRLLAIERTYNKFQSLAQRRQQHSNVKNLFVLNADAISVVSHFLQPKSVERVFLLYPNPYPKPKQANLRWHNSPFMDKLLSTMAPAAPLHLATNLEWYAFEAIEALKRYWGLTLLSHQKLDSRFIGRTHFERKYLERGETCHDMTFVRHNDKHLTSVYNSCEGQ